MSEQAKKYHATPTGQVRECKATKRKCPRSPLVHGSTKEEVEAIIAEGLEKKHGAFAQMYRPRRTRKMTVLHDPGNVLRNNHEMTPEEAKVIDDLKKRVKKATRQRFHRERYDLKGGDPEVAEKRLDKSAAFADKKNDPHLLQKIREVDTVLPTGKFTQGEGKDQTVVTSDKYIKEYERQKRFKNESEKVRDKITEFASSPDVKTGKYELENDDAKVSVTVTDGQVDEDFLSKLPKDVQKKITKPDVEVDLDRVRKNLSKEDQAKVLTRSSRIDVILSREHTVGQYVVNGNTDFKGATNEEKLESGMDNLAQLHSDAKAAYGMTQRDMRKQKDSMNAVLKDVVKQESNTDNPTYIPARAEGNGLIVSGVEKVNQKSAFKNLTKEQLEKVTVVKRKADEELAKKYLSEEDYAKLFGKRKVRILVNEK